MYAPVSGAVAATNATYGGTLAPHACVTIGRQVSRYNNRAGPTAFTLNATARTG